MMEHLWGQSLRVGLPMESTNAGTCRSGVGDLEVVFVPPGAAVFGLEQTCTGVYVNNTAHDFCITCRPCLTFSWTACFLAGA